MTGAELAAALAARGITLSGTWLSVLASAGTAAALVLTPVALIGASIVQRLLSAGVKADRLEVAELMGRALAQEFMYPSLDDFRAIAKELAAGIDWGLWEEHPFDRLRIGYEKEIDDIADLLGISVTTNYYEIDTLYSALDKIVAAVAPIIAKDLLVLTVAEWEVIQRAGRVSVCTAYGITFDDTQGWINPVTGEASGLGLTYAAELAFVQAAALEVQGTTADFGAPIAEALKVISGEILTVLANLRSAVAGITSNTALIENLTSEQRTTLANLEINLESYISALNSAEISTIMSTGSTLANSIEVNRALLQSLGVSIPQDIGTRISAAQASTAIQIATLQSVISGQINTMSDQVISALNSHAQAAGLQIANAADRVIGGIDEAEGHVIDEIHSASEDQTRAIDQVGQQVDGINDFSLPLGAALGAGVLSMAGLGSLLNTAARTGANQMCTARTSCMPSTGAAVIGQLAKAAIPIGVVAGYKMFPPFQNFVNDMIEKAWGMYLQPLQQNAPITPEKAPQVGVTLYANAVAMGAGAHLTSLAAESISPLKHMGLGYLSAFLADMGAFSRLAAATLGVLVSVGLGTPFRYNVQNMLRPWLLSPRDFQELMSRRAFTEPEVLQNPALLEAVAGTAPGGGAGFESAMIGYYGYPDSYLGFFKELANARLGYFALAGVARTGFFDERWFIEALHRTGYSDTAVARLMEMYKIQATDAREAPVRTILRYLHRDGFITADEYRSRMDRVAELKDFTEIRILANEWEREYRFKDDSADIIIRAFTRGVLSESEALEELAKLGLPGDIAQQKVLWEKLGMAPKIKLEIPEPVTPIYEVVEGE